MKYFLWRRFWINAIVTKNENKDEGKQYIGFSSYK